jgi:hypothetical protein
MLSPSKKTLYLQSCLMGFNRILLQKDSLTTKYFIIYIKIVIFLTVHSVSNIFLRKNLE